MYEGVNASDGIGIGVARVAVEPDLSFTPHAPEDAKAEEDRYQAAVAKFIDHSSASCHVFHMNGFYYFFI